MVTSIRQQPAAPFRTFEVGEANPLNGQVGKIALSILAALASFLFLPPPISFLVSGVIVALSAFGSSCPRGSSHPVVISQPVPQPHQHMSDIVNAAILAQRARPAPVPVYQAPSSAAGYVAPAGGHFVPPPAPVHHAAPSAAGYVVPAGGHFVPAPAPVHHAAPQAGGYVVPAGGHFVPAPAPVYHAAPQAGGYVVPGGGSMGAFTTVPGGILPGR